MKCAVCEDCGWFARTIRIDRGKASTPAPAAAASYRSETPNHPARVVFPHYEATGVTDYAAQDTPKQTSRRPHSDAIAFLEGRNSFTQFKNTKNLSRCG